MEIKTPWIYWIYDERAATHRLLVAALLSMPPLRLIWIGRLIDCVCSVEVVDRRKISLRKRIWRLRQCTPIGSSASLDGFFFLLRRAQPWQREQEEQEEQQEQQEQQEQERHQQPRPVVSHSMPHRYLLLFIVVYRRPITSVIGTSSAPSQLHQVGPFTCQFGFIFLLCRLSVDQSITSVVWRWLRRRRHLSAPNWQRQNAALISTSVFKCDPSFGPLAASFRRWRSRNASFRSTPVSKMTEFQIHQWGNCLPAVWFLFSGRFEDSVAVDSFLYFSFFA